MTDRDDDEQQDQRDESEAERLDRNYDELLQELRVLQAGIQILFAFLLSIGFQSRFASVSDFERDIYVVTLLFASLTAACFIGPAPFHRIVFRRGMKDDLMKAANRYVSAGLCFLFLSMTGALMLVLDFVLKSRWSVVIALAIAVVYAVLWLVIPLRSRASEDDDTKEEV